MTADALLCRLTGRFGSAGLRSLSGALVELTFDLGGGRTCRPLAAPPWGPPPDLPGDPPAPHLTVLGGEWPCVPFGRSSADPVKHGYGTDHHWQLVRHDATGARLAIDYPADHPVARLERTVALSDSAPRVELSLTVHARRPARVPMGLHPILALPASAGALRLRPGAHGSVRTAPAALAPAASRLQPDQEIGPDGIARLKPGDTICLWDQPGPEGEDLVLIRDCGGTLVAENRAEGFATRLTWDAAALPHLLLWIANPGLGQEPRLPGFRGLGVEPVAAFFDNTPDGPEGAALEPGRPLTIRYAIECSQISPEEGQP